MNNNKKLAELARRKKVLEAKVSALKETKAKSSLAYLIESELEKAEVVMVAKSVVDKLQKAAEEIAKIEGNDIIPAMEALKSAFGPNLADAFQKVAGEQLRNLVGSITQAKDAISSEVGKFEGVLNGEQPGNDMAAPADPMAGGADDADLGLEPDAEDDLGMEDDGEFDLGGDDAGVDPLAVDGDDASGDDFVDSELDASFDDMDNSVAAGRAKKESAAPKAGAKALAEAKDPDVVIAAAFSKKLREGVDPVKAAKAVAKSFDIDFSDVVAIVRETRLGK